MINKKECILDTALRLFSERGLDRVTVREICDAAGVNVAMINYHFSGKDGLYRACIEHVFHQSSCEGLGTMDGRVHDAASWKKTVSDWIGSFSRAIRSETGGASIVAGMFRQEVINPSEMCKIVCDHYVVPAKDCLSRLIGMAVSDAAEQRLWVESIWSQLSAYALVDARWHGLFRPSDVGAGAWGDAIADFICRRVFSELRYRPALRQAVR